MNKSNDMKYRVFEYIIYRIHQFYQNHNSKNKPEDFDIIKWNKLLFLICGIDKENHLFDIFRFQGWFYGHMDPDIYNEYSKKDIIITNEPIIEDPEIKKRVDICIDKMINLYPNTLFYDKWNLVNLCKAHHSYNIYVDRLNRCYEDMDVHMLINEPKYFK